MPKKKKTKMNEELYDACLLLDDSIEYEDIRYDKRSKYTFLPYFFFQLLKIHYEKIDDPDFYDLVLDIFESTEKISDFSMMYGNIRCVGDPCQKRKKTVKKK